MTYEEKLKHPMWQQKRLKIMERDGFHCQSCASKDKTLHVHHKFYRKGKDPWDYEDDVLITLCEDCHKGADVIRIKITESIAKLDANDFEFALGLIDGIKLRDDSNFKTKCENFFYARGISTVWNVSPLIIYSFPPNEKFLERTTFSISEESRSVAKDGFLNQEIMQHLNSFENLV